jgi:tetratricopeptide (TPR) repeat protein
VKTISVIAKEMDVGYLLEGSGQRDGNNVRITVQLLDANEDTHIWADTHIRETEDVFDLQREVARLIVEDLETLLSRENDQTSEELPPNILIAEAFFQRGLKEMSKYWNMPNRETQEKAEDLFRYSLEYDSTLIPSYKQLAQIYQNKYADQIDYMEDALDSVLVIAEKSLLLDPRDSYMLRLKSWVFRSRGENELARDALEQAIIYDPELQNNYIRLARLYMDMDNIPKALETFFKVLDLNSESVTILKSLSSQFRDYGLKDLSLQYLEEAFRLDRDTIYYYNRRGRIEWAFGDFDSAIVYQLKAVEMDSLNSSNLSILAICYLFNHQYELSMIYFKKHMERAEALNQRWVLPRYIGFVWIQNGQITEGERILNEIYITYQERLQLGIETKDGHRILGAIHAIRGEKEKAIEHLRSFALTTGIESFDLQTLENSPLYDNIRDEPEFQNIFKEVQDLVQRKHDQMRQWLEENDRL